MKRLLSSSITSTAKQPIVQGTIEFLQDSYKEIFNALVNGMIIYTTNDLIILYGCVVSGLGPYDVTAGAIYYNGEVYLVDAVSGLTPGGGQTIVWKIVQTFDNTIDPLTFSDLSQHSVHEISKIALQVGVSGSGIADYNGATVKNIIGSNVTITALNSWVNTGSLAKYKILGNGDVLLTGSIGCNGVNVPSSGVMFQLPAGFRPTTLRTFIMLGADNGSVYGAFRMTIATNGNVSFLTAGGGAATFDAFAQAFLNGIRFNIAD